MDEGTALAVGDITVADVGGAQSLPGVSIELDLGMLVARLTVDRVTAVSNKIVFVGAEELGVDTLIENAEPPGITRTAAATPRLVFTSGMETAASRLVAGRCRASTRQKPKDSAGSRCREDGGGRF